MGLGQDFDDALRAAGELFLLLLIAALLALLIVGLAGCATVEAVTNAPEDFWIQVELILGALGQDIWSIVELFL